MTWLAVSSGGLATIFEEEPDLNPNTGTMELSLRDPDLYYITISAPRE
jgi:hypothetical protein